MVINNGTGWKTTLDGGITWVDFDGVNCHKFTGDEAATDSTNMFVNPVKAKVVKILVKKWSR